VSSIIITNPGTGYSNSDTLTVTLSGGGYSNSNAASLGTVSFTTNTSGGLTKVGTGTLNLTGANTYTGTTTLNQGTLTVGTGGTLGATTAPLSVNNTNTTAAGTATILNLATAANTTVGSLSGSISTPTSGTNTATINTQTGRTLTVNQTTDGTYAGVIAGAGNVTLGSLSTNKLTLTAANLYSGTTTVNAGTLIAANTTALGTSNVSIGASGTLAIGAGASSQELDMNGTFTNNGTVTMNIYSNAHADGLHTTTDADFIKFTGSDRLISLTGNFTIGAPNSTTNLSGVLGLGDAFELFDWNNISSGNRASSATFTLPSLQTGYSWDTSNILGGALGANIGYVMVVPEPSRIILMFVGFSALFMRRRRS
jgi:autotransporter-associated beta strand protein